MAGKTDVVRCGHDTWWNHAADSMSGVASEIYRGFIMVTREQLLKLLREQYPYLATEYGIKRIGIFGSYAKGEPEETSDVDILVEFERPIGFKFIELVEYLERLLGRRVDVLTPAGLQGIRVTHVAQDIAESVVYV
jgi:predicted nucleotidyltransferase